MRNKTFCSFMIILLLLMSLTGCSSSSKTTAMKCPFSDLTWKSTVADMEKSEGKDSTTYKSVYGGTTYKYAKTYNDKEGMIKYMFDDKEQLMCIAWVYSSKDENDLKTLYQNINQSTTDLYGDSGYDTEKETNYGNVWTLEDGTITLSVLVTDSNKALQYAYMNPASIKNNQ